jgi:alpha-1,2-mannosyltransferase
MHYRYPPLFLLLFAPLTWLKITTASFVWALLKCAVLAAGLCRLIRRWGPARRINWTVAICIAAPYFVMELRYGNAQFFVFALTAWAMLSLERRPLPAAAALGLATALKVWPFYFIAYWAALKKWRAAVCALAVALLLMLAPAIYFGWDRNAELLSAWWNQEYGTASQAGHVWFPSQSLLGVLTRHLTEVDYAGMPDPNYPRVEWVALEPALVRAAWVFLVAAGGFTLWLLARRAGGVRRLEADGIAFCALVLLQPYTQKQTTLVVLLWPALVAAAALRRPMNRWGRAAIYAAAAVGMVQVLAQSPPIQRLLQALGTDALLVALLAGGLLLTIRNPSH